MTPDSEPKPSEEERLMALLALTAQKLPKPNSTEAIDLDKLSVKSLSPTDVETLHAYLDAHPEAFEELLRRRRAAVPTPGRNTSRAWRDWFASWQMPVPRYALALGVAVLCAILVSFAVLDSPKSQVAALERSYAELTGSVNAQALVNLTAAEPPTEAQLGFSARSNDATSGTASFAAGVEAGRQRIQTGAMPQADVADEQMYVLGQWNMLLWTACELHQPLSPAFWSAQNVRFQTFAAELRTARHVDPVVLVHAQRIEALLAQLSERYAPRAAHELAQELFLFRTRFGV